MAVCVRLSFIFPRFRSFSFFFLSFFSSIAPLPPMSHSYQDISDSPPPSEPPPSYHEAISQTGTASSTGPGLIPPPHPPRPTSSSSSSYQRPQQPPAQPQRPPQRPPRPSGASSSASSSTASLYTNNPNLPFNYTKGYYCQKCKNTGFKIKNGRACRDCFDKFYLRKHAYNPNPSLPFQYPTRYLCDKCNNTGVKLKNGLACQDCYQLFAPRNVTSTTYSSFPDFSLSSFMAPFSSSNFSVGGPFAQGGSGSVQPIRVMPGDPRIGGVLCGRCRGSGMINYFLDSDLCNVCGGTGRILGNNRPMPGPPPQQFQGMYQPPPGQFHPPPPGKH